MKTKPIEQQLSVATMKGYVREINQLHAELESESGSVWKKARHIGNMLNEIRETVPHGEWLGWLKENFKGSQQSACNYMRVAKLPDSGNFTSIAGYLASLKPPKPEPPAPVPAVAPQLPQDEPEADEPTEDPPHITTPAAGQGDEATPETEAAVAAFQAARKAEAAQLAGIQKEEHRPLPPPSEEKLPPEDAYMDAEATARDLIMDLCREHPEKILAIAEMLAETIYGIGHDYPKAKDKLIKITSRTSRRLADL